jgi:CPA1 family monovalent cation:H+ antiporter
MTHPATFVLLLTIATLVSVIARQLRMPYTVALVVAGLALGATHAISAPPLTRELMFTLVLPGLLFEAAFDLELEEMRRDGLTLASLAVPGVIAAIVIVVFTLGPAIELFGAPPQGIPGRQAALLFAALIAATDPVAVVSLFRALDAPRRLQVIVEGESLLNDGTAIIFFTLALASATGGAVSASVVTDFFYIVGAGIIVGGLIGALAAEGIRRLTEPMLEVMLTTIAAYGSFVAAEGVSASGVIATVTAGALCGSRAGRRGMSAEARIAAATFWEYIAFVLNSLVFLLIGLTVQVPMLLQHWRSIVAAYTIVTLSRAIVTSALAVVLPSVHRLPPRWTAILALGGLRGALSMVLAVSVPLSFPQRDLLITITFGVVILSILAQGITVGPALKWLGLRREREARLGYMDTRAALLSTHRALEDLDRTASMVATDGEMRRVLAAEYDERIARAEDELASLGASLGAGDGATLSARRLVRDTERQRVLDAFHGGGMSIEERDRRLADIGVQW